MKQNINKLIGISLVLMVTLAGFISCGDMNETQSEYAKRDEIVYLGKVDSLKTFPGFGRAKVTWYIGSDPRIEKTVIYWNQRKDSIELDFARKSPGLQKDSIIIDNLQEGATLYEFRNKNSKGEYSLFSEVAVTSWGGNFADLLRARRITYTVYDNKESVFNLKLTPAAVGDSVVYSQIIYTDNAGTEQIIRIGRETNELELTGFKDGGEFNFRNIFFLPQGMDTVYSDYHTIRAPKVKQSGGTKITFPGNPASYYSTFNNNSIYEWNLEGDLILHEMDQDGHWSQVESYPNLVPKSIYRHFFFYDDDKFIGVGLDNNVYMLRIENNIELVYVRTPTGAAHMGAGFSMPVIIPSKGFFYSVDSNGGQLRSWYAQNNATWPATNGVQQMSIFPYNPVALFGHQYLISVDENGDLWSFQTSTSGAIRNTYKIGSGWDRFVKMFSFGEKLIAIDENGDFYEFDFDPIETYWVVD